MAINKLGPVVKSEKRRFDRVLPDYWWLIRTHYNINTKIFTIPYPPQFSAEFPKWEPAMAKTIEAAQARFDDAIKTWEASSVNIEKVLLYRFPIAYEKLKTSAKGRKAVEFRREDAYASANDKSMSLSFKWDVGYRRQVTGQEPQYFGYFDGNPDKPNFQRMVSSSLEPENDREDVSIPNQLRNRGIKTVKRGARWVKWSKEREDLLKSLGLAFGELIERVMTIEKQLETEVGMDEVIARSSQLLLTSSNS